MYLRRGEFVNSSNPLFNIEGPSHLAVTSLLQNPTLLDLFQIMPVYFLSLLAQDGASLLSIDRKVGRKQVQKDS